MQFSEFLNDYRRRARLAAAEAADGGAVAGDAPASTSEQLRADAVRFPAEHRVVVPVAFGRRSDK